MRINAMSSLSSFLGNRSRVGLVSLLTQGLLFGSALVFGFLVAQGSGLVNLLMVGGVLGLFIVATNTLTMLVLMSITVCLVIGQLMYFGGINQALWLAYGLGALLFIHVPGAYLRSPFVSSTKTEVPLLPLIGAFVLFVLISIAINVPPPLQAIVGSKNLLALWSVFLIIALFAVPAAQIEKLFKWLLPLAFLQLPFVLYQYFVVAANRSNRGGRSGVSWDAIVGSFGGDPNSGGASGVMAFSLVLSCLLVIALWRKHLFSGVKVVAVLAVAGVCIALAEVKVVVVLLPIGIAVVALPSLVKKPLTAIGAVIITLALMVCLLYVYDSMHYAAAGQQAKSLSDLMDKAFGYSLDSQYINFVTGEMGRMAALSFWWNEGFLTDPLHGLFGYGPGASRISSFATGEVARLYSFGIDRSAATQLLWDVGLAGFLSFSLVLVWGSTLAYKAARRCADLPARQATLEVTSAMLVMMLLMLPYGRDLLEVPALGFFMMVGLGYAAQVTTSLGLKSAVIGSGGK